MQAFVVLEESKIILDGDKFLVVKAGRKMAASFTVQIH
jgi:hypothetical protein